MKGRHEGRKGEGKEQIMRVEMEMRKNGRKGGGKKGIEEV